MRCVVLLLGAICAAAQTKFDYYPEIRSLLREAEAAAAGTVRLEDGGDPLAWLGRLYERGGYLDDARRVFLKSSGATLDLRARVVYGDLTNALAEAESKKDPVERAGWFESIANTLWRAGQPERAATVLAKADAAAKAIPDPKKREIRLQITAQLRGALNDAPPSPLTAEPQPRPKKIAEGTGQLPSFPVTADGFRKRTGAEVAADAQTNAAFLTQLYSLVAIGNRNGIEQIIESSGTAHRKILALASLEHLALLQGQPDFAEKCAARMPVGDGNLLLLKAEAFSAAGAGWGRAKDFDRANKAFDEALQLVDFAGREWAYGKAIVTAAIAAAQAESGLTATSQETFDLALRRINELPARPQPKDRAYSALSSQDKFRADAFQVAFAAALRARDLSAAKRISTAWTAASPNDAPSAIRAWLVAGRKEEALEIARALDGARRVSALLSIAAELLDEAGAPLL